MRGFKTDKDRGIDCRSIAARDEEYGNNRKVLEEPKSFWFFAAECFEDFLLRVLTAAGIFSIVVDEIMHPEARATAWIEGGAILIAVLLIVVVTAVNNLKKEKEFRKLNSEAESGKVVTMMRDGDFVRDASIEEVLVGDVAMLKAGMEIPGDAILLEGFAIKVDESSMTGESDAMQKETLETCLQKREAFKKKNPGKAMGHHDIPSPILLSGTKVISGNGKMVIMAVGSNSTIGRVNALIESNDDELTPLQMKLEKIARDIGSFGFILAIILVIALITKWIISMSWNGGLGWETTPIIDQVNTVLQIVLMGVAILVMAIPEGLPLAVTLSLAYSVDQMMRENNLVRKLEACETMGGANIICSDKTGTLTKNEMYLTQFWSGVEQTVYNTIKGTVTPIREVIHADFRDRFINTIVLNSLEDPSLKKGNPTEMALLGYLHRCGVPVVQMRDKVPVQFQAAFSSDRKRMSTIVKVNGKSFVFAKGASEYILDMCSKVANFSTGEIKDCDLGQKVKVEQVIKGMAQKALRTIGLAYKEVDFNSLNMEPNERGIYPFEQDGFTLVGICGIKDVIRPEVPDSILKCNKAGIDVKMVTGDNKITAEAIAREIGIISPDNHEEKIVIEGPEFLRLVGGVVSMDTPNDAEGKKGKKDTIKNGAEFDKIWRKIAVMARSRPEDKYALVTGLKERGNCVAVTGDGTNDAPALSKADVGFAMNIAGTEVAKQAADILLMDDNFASIVVAAKWGRNIYDSIRKFLVFQLTVNVVAVSMTFVSAVGLNESVFSTVQILWINLIMDTFAALALATEPPSEELLNRKPQSKKDYIISAIMSKHIFAQSLYQVMVMIIFVFGGPYFLKDVWWGRQLQAGSPYIVSGFQYYGYKNSDHGDEFSVHAAYNFNVFVMLQLANFFNCRILDDSLNIFKRIWKSHLMIGIIAMIFVLQAIILTVGGPGIKVVQWGLDPWGWAVCIVFACGSWVVSAIFKFLPLEHMLQGSGREELDKEDLNKANPVALRKPHNEDFFRKETMSRRRSSFVQPEGKRRLTLEKISSTK